MYYDPDVALGSAIPLQSETVNKKYFKFVCIIATCPSVLTFIQQKTKCLSMKNKSW